MRPIIEIENVSKQYRLGYIGHGSLSDDLSRWWSRIKGKEDPFLKIGETNDRSSYSNSDYVWALRDINLSVEQGDILGIIGKNGAGKSTLLKILSRVTTPSTGKITARGRIASLLEVGTGFHAELTGRENIFLNGSILGMQKKEIQSKLDEIIAFSGCERYIDTPVKRYSSGMYVRLAFAVAAHLDPDILIIDEVLAVGDAEFQKKAIGKMQDISKGEGRTILFVSHNMGAIKNLCNKSIVMDKGTITGIGNTQEIVMQYFSENIQQSSCSFDYENQERTASMGQKVKTNRLTFNKNNPIYHNSKIEITFSISVYETINDVCFGFGINTPEGSRIVTLDSDSNLKTDVQLNFEKGNYEVVLYIDEFCLEPGLYTFDFALRVGKGTLHVLDYFSNQSQLEVMPQKDTPNHLYGNKTGSYRPIPGIKRNNILS